MKQHEWNNPSGVVIISQDPVERDTFILVISKLCKVFDCQYCDHMSMTGQMETLHVVRQNDHMVHQSREVNL